MPRHNSALELAYAIQINLAASEEARLQAKRDSMARWRKKKAGGRYPTRTTPEASAEAAKLRSTPSPEGRRKAQSLEMAMPVEHCSHCHEPLKGRDDAICSGCDKPERQCSCEPYGDWAERVGKARDWPQCDQCGAPKAADDGKGEPVVDHGNYLCRRCASKVGKAWFLEDPITESVLRKQSTMPMYATAGVNGAGEEGNEDDGNYSNPDERPLYQQAGAWPDELWTNTDPDDKGKQGQEAIDSSERYYLNKANTEISDSFYNNLEEAFRFLVAAGKDVEHMDTVNRDKLKEAKDGILGLLTDFQTRQEAGFNPTQDPFASEGTREAVEEKREDAPTPTADVVKAQLRKMNDWYANGGQIDAADYQELPTPSKVDNHVDDQGSTEHHKQDDPGHSFQNPRSCIYCGHQNGHSLLCDRPANKAIDLSFLGPIMKGTEMIDAGPLSPAEALRMPTDMHHSETVAGDREAHLVINAEDDLEITDGKHLFELPTAAASTGDESGVTINIKLSKAVRRAHTAAARLARR